MSEDSRLLMCAENLCAPMQLGAVSYGDRLIARARVERRGASAVELEVWVENQNGQRVLAGQARLAPCARAA